MVMYFMMCNSLEFFSRVHATLQPALSVGRSVGQSVTLYFFYVLFSSTSLLLPKWSGDLKYGPCPPNATSVAVYPALFEDTRKHGCTVSTFLN